VKLGISVMHDIGNVIITPEILKLIADIDEFKGRWKVIESLAPERLTSLRRIATIESAGSSTRIEGAKLNDAEVEKLSCSPGWKPSRSPVATSRKSQAMPMRWK
jgi:hypothetical protein